jgi:hypothetical protein
MQAKRRRLQWANSLTMTYHLCTQFLSLCMKTVHWIHQGEETHQRKCSHTNNNNKKEPREKDPDRPSRCVTHLATTHTQQMNTPFSLLDLLQAVLFLHY